MYVYLTQQLRSSLVRSGQSFTLDALTSGCFECSQEYGCCVISVGSCETSAEILLWTFNQTFVCNVPVSESQPFHQRPSFYWSETVHTHVLCVFKGRSDNEICRTTLILCVCVQIFFEYVFSCIPITLMTLVVASSI